MTTTASHRWKSDTQTDALRRLEVPRTGVIGEIKPHNTRGIAAGIAQLRTRRGITRRTPAAPSPTGRSRGSPPGTRCWLRIRPSSRA